MYYPLPQCVGALNIPFRSPLAGSAFLRLLSELLRLRDITTGSGTSPRHSCSSQLIFYFNFPVFEGEWLHQWIYFYSLFKILNQLILTLTLSLWSNSKSTFLSNFYFLSLSRTNRFKVKACDRDRETEQWLGCTVILRKANSDLSPVPDPYTVPWDELKNTSRTVLPPNTDPKWSFRVQTERDPA